jgi:hypothetical protein
MVMSVSFVDVVVLAVLSSRDVGLVRLGPGHREQGEAGVADVLEQAVQGGLVDDKTLDEGGAVISVGQGHPVEAGDPAGCEAALDADAVPAGVSGAGVGVHGAPWVVRFVHARSGPGEQASPQLVIGLVKLLRYAGAAGSCGLSDQSA